MCKPRPGLRPHISPYLLYEEAQTYNTSTCLNRTDTFLFIYSGNDNLIFLRPCRRPCLPVLTFLIKPRNLSNDTTVNRPHPADPNILYEEAMRLITSSLSLVPVFILSALGSLILPVSPAPSPAVFSGIDVCTDPSGIICCNSVFYAANYHTPLPVGKILELEDVLDSLAPLELKPKNSSCHHLDHADHDHDHDHNVGFIYFSSP